ncbi:hypothetical protein [Bordetella petrii]|uniref:hypothetical protein n=1 Tax=Bordetella petrii TaxID=94624 RepID=UPI001E50A530|nr:hypothetical protein [Bordetella petrii]MCD0503205.1 hypothetical protein [Bordetella petrii]
MNITKIMLALAVGVGFIHTNTNAADRGIIHFRGAIVEPAACQPKVTQFGPNAALSAVCVSVPKGALAQAKVSAVSIHVRELPPNGIRRQIITLSYS